MFRRLSRMLATLTVALCAIGITLTCAAPTAQAAPRPTIVLVHGAFADKTSWDGVASILRHDGYRVVAVDNPLRGPAHDAAVVDRTVRSLPGPVVLVGHSYGGAVITNIHDPKVTRLVYVAAFAPGAGEPIASAINPLQYPGSQLLPPALQLKVVRDATGVGGYNLDAYIEASAFPKIFAQDVGPATIKTMLAHQKSFAASANLELSGRPSWATTPSWYVVSANDRVIPPAAQRDAAKRIRARTTEIASSHASLVSHPAAVAGVIRQAAG